MKLEFLNLESFDNKPPEYKFVCSLNGFVYTFTLRSWNVPWSSIIRAIECKENHDFSRGERSDTVGICVLNDVVKIAQHTNPDMWSSMSSVFNLPALACIDAFVDAMCAEKKRLMVC